MLGHVKTKHAEPNQDVCPVCYKRAAKSTIHSHVLSHTESEFNFPCCICIDTNDLRDDADNYDANRTTLVATTHTTDLRNIKFNVHSERQIKALGQTTTNGQQVAFVNPSGLRNHAVAFHPDEIQAVTKYGNDYAGVKRRRVLEINNNS